MLVQGEDGTQRSMGWGLDGEDLSGEGSASEGTAQGRLLLEAQGVASHTGCMASTKADLYNGIISHGCQTD